MKRSAVTRDGPRRSTRPAYASADRQLPEGARDGGAEAGVGRGDPEVARRGDAQAGADREALDCRDDGLPDRREPADAAIAVTLVGDAVLRPGEGLELRDVGARDERLASRAAEHQHPDRVVGVDLLAGVGSGRSYMPHVSAFRAAGRLNVRVRTGPSRATRISSDATARSPGSAAGHRAVMPPSITSSVPVTKRASSEAR